MVVIFPVGVTLLYFWLLWSKRGKLQGNVEERLEDEDLASIAFLWEPYDPRFWWFELVETARRLIMTGVLSTIRPGTFTQICFGLLISIFFMGLICKLEPYTEKRDTWLAILASSQLILFYLSATFMKFRSTALDPFDDRGMGYLMVFTFVALFVLFILWAIQQKDDDGVSADHLAGNILAGSSRILVTSSRPNSTRHSNGSDSEDDTSKTGVQMTSMKSISSTGGGDGDRSSSFEITRNPMASQGVVNKAQATLKGMPVSRKSSNWKDAQDEDGNKYWYDETTGRTTWTEKQVASGNQQRKESSLRSSFSGNDGAWFEHTSPEGVTYYSQPKTGEVTWVKPEGVEVRISTEE